MASEHDRFSSDYDHKVRQYHSYLAEALFGLCYEFIKPGDRILDVGIGTGLSSSLFFKAGCQMYGMDGSHEMLALCKAKKIAHELVEQDILNLPWPYETGSMDHIISCGVFHFLGDLEKTFKEINRIQSAQGLFAFTIKQQPGQNQDCVQEIIDTIPVFTHSVEYINTILGKLQYEIIKDMTCPVSDSSYRLLCTRKTSDF